MSTGEKTELKCLENSSHIEVLSTLEIPFKLTAEGMFETFSFFRIKPPKRFEIGTKGRFNTFNVAIITFH